MSTVPSLAQTQALLRKLITAPEGAAAGLARLQPAERDLSACIRGGRRLSAVERLDVYADMYFYRLRDCLKEDFSAVLAIIGEGHFHNLITDYLLAHPPSHFSLRYAGRHVPEFLTDHALSTLWPFLADLATLEWAILDAFDAADVPPVDAAALTVLAPEQWPALTFEVTPSLRLLQLSWPVHDVWRDAQAGVVPLTDIRPEPTMVRVWRQDLRVFHRPIDAAEHAALQAMVSQLTFADICERLMEPASDLATAERAVTLIHAWLADGLLTGVRAGDGRGI